MRKRLHNWLGDHYALVLFTNLCGLAFIVGIGWICAVSGGSPRATVVNTLVSILGGLVGWALGMFFAPYSKAEEEKFSTIGKTLSAFISGYVISKLDRFLESMMFVEVTIGGTAETTPIIETWFRFALFAASLLVVMLVVLSNRTYFGVYKETA